MILSITDKDLNANFTKDTDSSTDEPTTLEDLDFALRSIDDAVSYINKCISTPLHHACQSNDYSSRLITVAYRKSKDVGYKLRILGNKIRDSIAEVQREGK